MWKISTIILFPANKSVVNKFHFLYSFTKIHKNNKPELAICSFFLFLRKFAFIADYPSLVTPSQQLLHILLTALKQTCNTCYLLLHRNLV